MVSLWAAVTDLDWFDMLAAEPAVDEVDFWQPSGRNEFHAIRPGELFLFKLKAPRNVIGGFGVFQHASNLPVSLAWEAFGRKNGVASLPEMRARIARYRHEPTVGDFTIGCRIVVDPVFLPERLWIPVPPSWAGNTVVGKTFSTDEVDGRRLWDQVHDAASQLGGNLFDIREQSTLFDHEFQPRTGAPQLILPRLGQGSFRVAVTDAYGRECGLTNGRVLPALDAAHIRSWSEGGEHAVSNGILLRRDIHRVFDAGYATFDEDMRFVVSDRVRTEFNNGEEYRRLRGLPLKQPADPRLRPDRTALEWHRQHVFLG
jgi:putative restriction endonuclease